MTVHALGAIALLLQLGCREKYLNETMEYLGGRVMPNKPLLAVQQARFAIDLVENRHHEE